MEKKVQVLLGLVVAAFVVLLVRLAYLQLVEVDKYQVMARQNHLRLIPIMAPRGEMYDRNGVRIVGNRPVYTVSLAYLGLQDTDRVIARLASILVGERAFQGMSEQEIQQEIQKKLDEQKNGQKLSLYEPLPVAEKVSPETVSRIEEQRLELPGVLIDVRPMRDYPYGDLLVPVLGYVGIMNQQELDAHKDEGYKLGDAWGKDGLEKTYEAYLKGERGARQVEVDASGRPVRDLGLKEPVPGDNLVLSVDARLQRVAQDALAKRLAELRREGYGQAKAGAAVVLDVNTGEILAMASQPTYDPTIFVRDLTRKEWNDVWAQISRDQSLLNRALSPYPPGSTFKMVVSAAALESGKVTPAFAIMDYGRYKYKTDWKPGGHGRVDLVRALKVSCDTYFWTVGEMLGPELIGQYAREFGLGEKTGVDLPGERAGIVPGPEQKSKLWKQYLDDIQKQMDAIRQEYGQRLAAAGEGEKAALQKEMDSRLAPLQDRYNKIEWELKWRDYDTMDMSIGQGNNYYTPLQLANYVAAIANGGVLYQPHLVKKIVAPDGQTVQEFSPREIRRVKVSPQTLAVIRQGMYQVSLPPDGTASSIFAGATYTVAGKTGTAEVQGHDNHAVFVAFAPYEKPEVAVAVVVEYGGHGGVAAGVVARQILDAYFSMKDAPPTAGLSGSEVQTQSPSGGQPQPAAPQQGPSRPATGAQQRGAANPNRQPPPDRGQGDAGPGSGSNNPPAGGQNNAGRDTGGNVVPGQGQGQGNPGGSTHSPPGNAPEGTTGPPGAGNTPGGNTGTNN